MKGEPHICDCGARLLEIAAANGVAVAALC